MNITEAQQLTAKPHVRVSEKLKVVLGTGAAVFGITSLESEANAGIVISKTTPVSTTNAPVGLSNWDVDSDGTVDFALVRSQFISTSSDYVYVYGYANFDDRNGGRLVVPQNANGRGIAKLSAGVNIGATMTVPYKFHAAAQNFNSITYNYNGSPSIGSDAFDGGWSLGDVGLFGFKFTSGGDTFYGWGEMAITDDANGFSILRAYYNDTPGGSIQVGVVPEPSSLALLSLGCAGLAAWRRKRIVRAL